MHQNHRRIFEAVIRFNVNVNISSRSYYTNRQNKPSLYSKLSPLGDPGTRLAPVLDDWEQKGNKIRFAELQRIVHDLRKRKRFTQALEVLEWMNGKGSFAFLPAEHAVRLDLIGKVHGYALAENYFSNLKDLDKTEKTYGALLHCYVRQREAVKSMSHLQKMKERGFALSAVTYNDIMCLYANTGQNEKVPEILTEMRKNGVYPDNLSYRISINSLGGRSDLEGMERVLKEMESEPHLKMDWNTYAVVANFYVKAGLKEKANILLVKAEEKLDNKDGIGFNHLISLHAQLDNKADVLRLWALEKTSCKRCINRDYITMLESLVKLGELEEAEKVCKEWELSGNCYEFHVPNTVIVGYLEKGLYEKADTMLKEIVKQKKASTPNIWGRLAAGYMDKGKAYKAVACMRTALSLYEENKGWKPNSIVISKILSWLSEKGSVEDIEAFARSLKAAVPMNREIYHAVIKTYIRAGKDVNGVLSRMKADKIAEDEETKKILGMKNKS